MKSKYRNKITVADNIKFHSAKEAARYLELKNLWRLGAISSLELQPKLEIKINDVKICDYKADFKYTENGAVIFEDVKGFLTPVYRLKKKMVLAVHGIEIREI